MDDSVLSLESMASARMLLRRPQQSGSEPYCTLSSPHIPAVQSQAEVPEAVKAFLRETDLNKSLEQCILHELPKPPTSLENEPDITEQTISTLFGDPGHTMQIGQLDTTQSANSILTSQESDSTPFNSFLLPLPNGANWFEDMDWLRNASSAPDTFTTEYHLRPAVRYQIYNRMGPGWEDRDDSGTYDPSVEHLDIPAAIPAKRKRIAPTSDSQGKGSNVSGSKRRATMHSRLARLTGYQTSISFKIDPEKLKHIIDNCSVKLADNWPEGLYSFLEAEETPSMKPGQQYALRDRKLVSTTPNLEEGLRNHPAGRGCRACYESGQECSVREPGAQYPCVFCIEDDCDCLLLISPAKKQACEGCKLKRRECSYIKNTDQAQPCSSCQEDGMNCIAGPAADPTRARIGYDGKPAALIIENRLKTRPYLKCTACRERNSLCSLKNYDDQPPCVSCKAQGVACTFKTIRKGAKPDGGASEPHMLTMSEPASVKAPVSKSAPESRSRQKGNLPTKPDALVIRTKLAHPLSFNHPEPVGEKTCHWCIFPTYGLVGYGEREVTVLELADETGYEEISGGHRDDGLDTSRMCSDCTFRRVLITVCLAHQLGPLEDGQIKDWENLLTELDKCRKSSDIREYYSKICSICPSPAEFMCCTPQEGCLPVKISREGCGLRLCKKCAAYLKSPLFGGALHKMIVGLELVADDRTLFPEGLRADATFLRPDSQMMKQVLA